MASQDMGTLLLKGWAMLEACCEDCSVPLMRSPDKKQEICVECKTDFKNQAAKTKLQTMQEVSDDA